MDWLRAQFQRQVVSRPALLRIINNIGWLTFDRLLRMGGGLLVGVWVARYLGPAQFGQLNYGIAFVGLFSAVAGLGLNTVVVRDVVREPESANAILGTAFVLQIVGGLVSIVLVIVTTAWLRTGDQITRLIVLILSPILMFKATDVVKYWFDAHVQSKYAVWVEDGAFVCMAAVKVALILTNASLMAFVWATLIEAALVASGYVTIYTVTSGHLRFWKLQASRAKSLFLDSWPLMLAGAAITVYMRIDQVMLGSMIGDEAVGLYAAAVKVSELCYFIPMAIGASVLPAIVRAKAASTDVYSKRIQQLLNFMMILALSIALPIAVLAVRVMDLVFGSQYAESGYVLAVHIWASLFVFSGVVSGQWLLLEDLQRILFYRALVGSVVNIVLNIYLISFDGIVGAAWATLISQFVAAVLVNALSRRSRPLFFMQLRAFFFIDAFRAIRAKIA